MLYIRMAVLTLVSLYTSRVILDALGEVDMGIYNAVGGIVLMFSFLNGTMSIVGPRPVAEDQFEMFRYGKWNEAAKVPVGLSGPAALYDYIYGDQITDEREYMEKVYPTRRELEYTYVQKAGLWYDLKMIIYTVICIIYALLGKECTWILRELQADADESSKVQ